MKNRFLTIVIEVIRIVMATVFITSSILKAIDPIGLSLKISEYATVIPLDIKNIIVYLSLPFAFILLIVEFILGMQLLLVHRIKQTSFLAFLLMIFMTVVTSIIYTNGDINDCGCFGDAIHLSNGETLLKNIILLSFSFFLWKNHFLIRSKLSQTIIYTKYIALFGFVIFTLSNCILLPIIDFRPYSVGTNIRANIFEEDYYLNKFLNDNTLYLYKKEGNEKKFKPDSIPNPNEGWQFVKVVQKEKQDINNLKYDFHPVSIKTKTDISNEIINKKEISILVLAQNIKKINNSQSLIIRKLAKATEKKGYAQYLLLSDEESINFDFLSEIYTNKFGCVATIDKTTINTIVRSSLAIMILSNGKIIYKGSWVNFPKLDNITNFVENINSSKPNRKWMISRCFVLFGAIVFGIFSNFKFYFKHKNKE